MNKQEIVEELREILKVYHYESDEQHISKDVVTSLENIIIDLTKVRIQDLSELTPDEFSKQVKFKWTLDHGTGIV